MNQYALILAGGSGTRFWPLSRDHRPKQLLNMFGEGTLLRQAIDRLDGLVPRQNIFILTNHLQEAEVAPPGPRYSRGQHHFRTRAPGHGACHRPGHWSHQGGGPARSHARYPLRPAHSGPGLLPHPDESRHGHGCREKALVTVGIKPTWPAPPTATLNAEKKSTPLRAVPAAKSFNSAKNRTRPRLQPT